jgi:molecular chaperone DnaJ
MNRTLTNRQRELLQAYVDDIEGRSPAAASDEASTADDNGTVSFTRSSSTPTGGWMSRAREHFRRLTGI